MKLPLARFTARRRIRTTMIIAVGLGVIWLAATAVRSMRQSALQAQCVNQLRFIGISLGQEIDVHHTYPRGTVVCPELPAERRLSWMTHLVQHYGYLESQPIFDQTQSWDSAANLRPKWRNWDELDVDPGEESRRELPVATCFVCPSLGSEGSGPVGRPSRTWYVGIGGLGEDSPGLPAGHPRCGVFGYDRVTKPSDVTDGLSSTMTVIETTDANGPWTAGGPSTVRGVDSSRRPYLGRGRQFGGLHRGGANALFADGSVRFLSETIDPRVFEALSTVAGGERLPAGWGGQGVAR